VPRNMPGYRAEEGLTMNARSKALGDVPPGSIIKAALVEALSWLFNLSPALAWALGQVVLALWPGFREG
jgi:hypothetical protein